MDSIAIDANVLREWGAALRGASPDGARPAANGGDGGANDLFAALVATIAGSDAAAPVGWDRRAPSSRDAAEPARDDGPEAEKESGARQISWQPLVLFPVPELPKPDVALSVAAPDAPAAAAPATADALSAEPMRANGAVRPEADAMVAALPGVDSPPAPPPQEANASEDTVDVDRPVEPQPGNAQLPTLFAAQQQGDQVQDDPAAVTTDPEVLSQALASPDRPLQKPQGGAARHPVADDVVAAAAPAEPVVAVETAATRVYRAANADAGNDSGTMDPHAGGSTPDRSATSHDANRPIEPVAISQKGPVEFRPSLSALREPVVRGAAVDVQDAPQQIVRAMRTQFRDGIGEASIRLRPEHLGEVRIELKVDGERVSAVLHVERSDVKQAIEAQSGSLRAGLAAQGLQLEELSVTDAVARDERGGSRETDRREGESGQRGTPHGQDRRPRRRRDEPEFELDA